MILKYDFKLKIIYIFFEIFFRNLIEYMYSKYFMNTEYL